ncbi:hypothetical protein ACJX0J_018708, partial [Zea mays]
MSLNLTFNILFRLAHLGSRFQQDPRIYITRAFIYAYGISTPTGNLSHNLMNMHGVGWFQIHYLDYHLTDDISTC